MRALADVLNGRGVIVSGSDIRESKNTAELVSSGITVHIGHDPENLGAPDCVIRTAAAHDDNPEIMAARANGIPVFERAEAWGAIMREFENSLCIAGTHGKTTTTSMAVCIAMADGGDPTVMIGGELPGVGTHRVGTDKLIIAEACEYCNSFLRFAPTVAAILNVEEDHLDFFSGIEDIIASFRAFAGLVPEDGAVVVNADDKNALVSVEGLDRRVATFGIENGDVRAKTIEFVNGCAAFDIAHDGGFIPVKLKVPGKHNIYNALCAAACALELGIDGVSIARGLEAFTGAKRRFEYKGELNGAQFYDDYAHHPSELAALFSAVENMGYERVISVFQPHTYTRTKALFDDFARELRRPDVSLILPIFAAREPDDGSVSSEMLAEKSGARAVSFAEAEAAVRELCREGDLVLTIGAGEAYKVAERLCAEI